MRTLKHYKHRILILVCLLCVTGRPNVLAGDPETEIQYLSGKGYGDTVRWDFYCETGRNSGSWTSIPVPSNWECEGFGEYSYGWEGTSWMYGTETKRGDRAIYRHKFQVPAQWAGQRIRIVFDGVMTDTEVFIDGAPAKWAMIRPPWWMHVCACMASQGCA